MLQLKSFRRTLVLNDDFQSWTLHYEYVENIIDILTKQLLHSEVVL